MELLHKDMANAIIKAFYKVIINYLKATYIEVDLLFNFGKKRDLNAKYSRMIKPAINSQISVISVLLI